jgi:hypothetical protein
MHARTPFCTLLIAQLSRCVVGEARRREDAEAPGRLGGDEQEAVRGAPDLPLRDGMVRTNSGGVQHPQGNGGSGKAKSGAQRAEH